MPALPRSAHPARGLALALTTLALALLQACGGGEATTEPTPEPVPTPAPVDPTPVPPDPAVPEPPSPVTPDPALVTLDYSGFTLQYDCVRHIALRYEYRLDADTGSAARPSTFKLDPALPAGCAQQTSTGTYASVVTGWDRGHLVTSNHMDASTALIARANYMTNIVPQAARLNQGIWNDAEDVAECYRDIAPVQVVGGVVLGDPSNDYFLSSHGIPTPEALWKIVLTTDPTSGQPRAIAWYLPNQADLGTLDSYLVSLDELVARVGTTAVGASLLAPLPADLKANRPATTWPKPAGCSTS